MTFWVFKNKVTGKYKGAFEDVDNPQAAYPKLGNRESAYSYADEFYEGDTRYNFKQNYQMTEVDSCHHEVPSHFTGDVELGVVRIKPFEEVEKDLGIPIRAIVTRAAAAESELGDVSTKFNILLDTSRELYQLRWFDRLKFLFGMYELKHRPPRGTDL